jgi:hypothetical protein
MGNIHTCQWSIETIRVGRWMSEKEFLNMTKTGLVQESESGTTHVVYPPDVEGFYKQAKKGAVYVEFDVPENSVKGTSNLGWAKILGPRSLEGRLASKKGIKFSMPPVTNIELITKK